MTSMIQPPRHTSLFGSFHRATIATKHRYSTRPKFKDCVATRPTAAIPKIEVIDLDSVFSSELATWAAEACARHPWNTQGIMQAAIQIQHARDTQCEILDLSFLNLCELPSCLSMLQHVTDLDLANNNFTSIPSEVYDLPALRELDLSYNDIPEEHLLFSGLRLNSLHVQSQRLDKNSDIRRQIHTALPDLQYLDLDHI